MILLITYDMHKPDRDYQGVIAKLKSFGSWAHDEESVWLVDTTLSPAQCRDALNSVTTEATYFRCQTPVEVGCKWSGQGCRSLAQATDPKLVMRHRAMEEAGYLRQQPQR